MRTYNSGVTREPHRHMALLSTRCMYSDTHMLAFKEKHFHYYNENTRHHRLDDQTPRLFASLL